MSDPVPISTQPPVAPAPASVDTIDAPPHEQKTVWTMAAGVVSALAGGAAGAGALFEHDPELKSHLILAAGLLMVLSTVLANIGSVFARNGGVKAAARVLERMTGTGPNA